MLKESILKTGDGTQLASYAWEPENDEVRACVVIVHGVGEHAMRYDEYACYFASQSIAVFSMDLRGHGKSPGKRGHTAPRSRILEDIDFLCYHVVEKYPDKPLFIYGHSMGGNIGLSHRLYGAVKPKGYIITSPWLILCKKVPAMQVLALKAVAALKPDLLIRSGIKSSQITSDEIQVELHHSDKISHGFISAKTAVDCWDYASDVLKRAGEAHGHLLLLHGADDSICSIEGSRTLKKSAGTQCTYQEWEGCKHELQHDKDRERVREVIAAWILERA